MNNNLLAEALQKLANEVDGLNFRAGEIVEAIGRTNWETLQLRLRGARSALAAYQPAPTRDEVIEECAKVADESGKGYGGFAGALARDIAHNIRALKASPQSDR